MSKANIITDSNGVSWEIIPTKPTSTERGGFIAESAKSSDTIPVRLGTDGKGYVDGSQIADVTKKFVTCTKAEYNALPTINPETIYFITDLEDYRLLPNVIDTEVSLNSHNAVENRAIAKAINDIKNTINKQQETINTTASSIGQPTDEQVTAWFDAHPEAILAIPNNSITFDKMLIGTLNYVTPEMFGAVGDGVTDDSNAINQCLAMDNVIHFGKNKTYRCDHGLYIQKDTIIEGNNSTIFVDSRYNPLTDDAIAFFRYQDRISNYSVTLNNVNIDFRSDYINAAYSMFYVIDMGETKKLTFNNVNITVAECTTSKQILNVYDNFSITNCSFINLSKGKYGGCIAINAHNDIHSSINNCYFKQYSGDEIIYGCGLSRKIISINDSVFEYDCSYLTKDTNMFSFYAGMSTISFNNCTIQQTNDTANRLKSILRCGDSGSVNSINFKNCYIECDLKSTVFTSASGTEYTGSADQVAVYDSTIISKNSPIVGSYTRVAESIAPVVSASGISCMFYNCKLTARYAIVEVASTAKWLTIATLESCVCTINDARAIFRSYFSNSHMFTAKDTVVKTAFANNAIAINASALNTIIPNNQEIGSVSYSNLYINGVKQQ